MNRTLKLRQGPQSPQHSPGGTQAPGLLGYDRGAWWRERWGASTSGHYPIFLQMPGNQPSCLIEVDPAWGADDLKAKIQDLHGVAASEVRLMHGGRELRSEDVALHNSWQASASRVGGCGEHYPGELQRV